MEHKNPLFYFLANITMVTDHDMPEPLIDAAIKGMKYGLDQMFGPAPMIYNVHYIEDYNLAHDQIYTKKPVERIHDSMVGKIFDYMTTNVYLCNDSNAISDTPKRVGSCMVTYPTYPALRMIDIPVSKICKLYSNPQQAMQKIAAHEIMHIHPLYGYGHEHCKNPNCVMFSTVSEQDLHQSELCPECMKKLQRFNSDIKFCRRITNWQMYNAMYYYVIKTYCQFLMATNPLMLPDLHIANKFATDAKKRIKLYYRELWMGECK